MSLPKPRIELAWTSDRDSLRDALARSELHLSLTDSLRFRCDVEPQHVPAADGPELGLRIGLHYRFR